MANTKRTESGVSNTRIHNPFQDMLVTELLEDPQRYRCMFSPEILVGETLAVFRGTNTVLLGPQGSGKSMILNLLRYQVVASWVKHYEELPRPLRELPPWVGISVNLVRAEFHAFGRRSVAKVLGEQRRTGVLDVDALCAADFLNHYLLREFLLALKYMAGADAKRFRDWLGISPEGIDIDERAREIADWPVWFGYYNGCSSYKGLLGKCEDRLRIWRSFLNANIDEIPDEVWTTKSSLSEPLHAMGNLLGSMAGKGKSLPLFVTIDQYEVLPELNQLHGTSLQRVVNTLIKSRDPTVFYKVGARTHDWGQELKVLGAESRIEVQRDFVSVDLADVLMRKEDSSGWVFPSFAKDVALKRIREQGNYDVQQQDIADMLGGKRHDYQQEAVRYFPKGVKVDRILKDVPSSLQESVRTSLGAEASPLDLRLAAAWILQRLQRKERELDIATQLSERPWERKWWRKERRELACLQLASLANQRRLYYGWQTIEALAGGNISALLLLLSDIWDEAAKMGHDPVVDTPLPDTVQTAGVFSASEKWRRRDRNEQGGGRHRYDVLGRIGDALKEWLRGNKSLSNPGHSGFSLRETDLNSSGKGARVRSFLENASNWAVMEERRHTSKLRGEGPTRRKWYLHPLLSPGMGVPHVRVKEPLYINDVGIVYMWFYENAQVSFQRRQEDRQVQQGQMEFGDRT